MKEIKLLKKKNIDYKSIRKILIIKLRGIGDVLLSIPVIENLREKFPDAEINFLTEPASKEILSENPYLTGYILLDRKEKRIINFINKIRKEKYDLVIDLFGNPRSAIISFLSSANYRVGYAYRMRKYAYNILLESRSDYLHNIDFNLDILNALNISPKRKMPEIFLTEKEKIFADMFFKMNNLDGKKVIGINPGAGWETRIWGFHKFAELADKLIEAYKFEIIIFWGLNEEYMYKRIMEMMHYKPVIAPQTTIKEMTALFRKCDFVISNDNGPMHIADSTGIPVLSIHGPTSPKSQGPIGLDSLIVSNDKIECLGCNLTKCDIGIKCMAELSAEAVFNRIIKWRNL